MEKINNMSINQEFLKLYVSYASQEQLVELDRLFKNEDYETINTITENFKNQIINNEDFKNQQTTGTNGVSQFGMTLGIALYNEYLKSLKDENYEYSLLKILSLIDKYESEKNMDYPEEVKSSRFSK